MTRPHDDRSQVAAKAALLALDVEPELLLELQSVLRDGETVEGFVEDAVRGAIQRRSFEADLTRQADASWRAYRQTCISSPAAKVFDEVEARMALRRKELGG